MAINRSAEDAAGAVAEEFWPVCRLCGTCPGGKGSKKTASTSQSRPEAAAGPTAARRRPAPAAAAAPGTRRQPAGAVPPGRRRASTPATRTQRP